MKSNRFVVYNCIYCIGANCDRAGRCRHHYANSNFATAVDWSTYGSGTMNTSGGCSIIHACGPHSIPAYEKYEPLEPGELTRYAQGQNTKWDCLEIANCREISVKLDDMVFTETTKIPLEYFDQVEELVINGNRFMRVEPKKEEPLR